MGCGACAVFCSPPLLGKQQQQPLSLWGVAAFVLSSLSKKSRYLCQNATNNNQESCPWWPMHRPIQQAAAATTTKTISSTMIIFGMNQKQMKSQVSTVKLSWRNSNHSLMIKTWTGLGKVQECGNGPKGGVFVSGVGGFVRQTRGLVGREAHH